MKDYRKHPKDAEYHEQCDRWYDYRRMTIRQLDGEDRWALYDRGHQLLAIGPWDSIRAVYRDARPAPSDYDILRETGKLPTPELPVELDLGDLGL